ncbi:hypothetical protein NEHOM01_1188 [Nematocida homosporus]|uniref:uncharacterized protein n=1 Tax=Nematocida homosporus TaxID=1912981 RepID=UPI00221F9219|nr:uncharacterized protein NEHOM01_1188 [Nematocida homosporus]KAI5185965.1 hypothetical protein NEHOM01_1188 [Nematocida homosporus]
MHKWLCDTTINRVLKCFSNNTPGVAMLGYPLKDGETPHTLLVSTFYFESLKSSGMLRISEWLAKIPIDTIQRMIIPLFSNHHWSLSVVYPKLGLGVVLDPLRPYHKEVSKILLQHSGVEVVLYNESVVQQTNSSDCGIYTLYYTGCLVSKKIHRLFQPVPAEFIKLMREEQLASEEAEKEQETLSD